MKSILSWLFPDPSRDYDVAIARAEAAERAAKLAHADAVDLWKKNQALVDELRRARIRAEFNEALVDALLAKSEAEAVKEPPAPEETSLVVVPPDALQALAWGH